MNCYYCILYIIASESFNLIIYKLIIIFIAIMGGSTNSCCSKDKAVEGSKGENFAPMDRERKSLFKKKKVNRSDVIDGLSSSGV